MHRWLPSLSFAAAVLACLAAQARPSDFSGRWSIDFRTPAERKRGVACGGAEFEFEQKGTRIAGCDGHGLSDSRIS